MKSQDHYTYVSIWNMNGGPLPNGVREALSTAVEKIAAETDEKDNVRVLWAMGERKADS